MKIYEFYIFNNAGSCLFHLELSGSRDGVSKKHNEDLMFGLIYSMKSFCKKFSPSPVDVNPFSAYITDTYKLHILESASGLNFLMLTDPDVPDQNSSLSIIYSQIFSPYVLRSPFYTPRKPIKVTYFTEKLKEYFETLYRAN